MHNVMLLSARACNSGMGMVLRLLKYIDLDSFRGRGLEDGDTIPQRRLLLGTASPLPYRVDHYMPRRWCTRWNASSSRAVGVPSWIWTQFRSMQWNIIAKVEVFP